MSVLFSARTDVGRIREQNEDNFLVDRKLQLYVVCDGMGGHRGGEVASATAVNTVRTILLHRREVLEREQRATEPDASAVRALLAEAVQEASRRIHERGRVNAEQRGMGTTLSLLLMLSGRAFVAHVGDSRIYRLRDGQFEQLTEDHSLYNAMLQAGTEPASAANPAQLRNAVTRAVGAQGTIEVDTAVVPMRPGDRFLLCSDGLYGQIDEDELHRMLQRRRVEGLAEDMVHRANEAGGDDNITALVVDLPREEAPESERPGTPEEILRRSPLGRGLDDAALHALLEWLEVRAARPGEVLAEPGEPAEVLYLIRKGRLLVELSDAVHVADPGDLLAESLWLTGRSHSGRLRVAEDRPAQLLQLRRGALEGLMEHAPGIAARLTEALASWVAQRVERVADETASPLWSYVAPQEVGARTHDPFAAEHDSVEDHRGAPGHGPPPASQTGTTEVELDPTEVLEEGPDASEIPGSDGASAPPPPPPAGGATPGEGTARPVRPREAGGLPDTPPSAPPGPGEPRAPGGENGATAPPDNEVELDFGEVGEEDTRPNVALEEPTPADDEGGAR